MVCVFGLFRFKKFKIKKEIFNFNLMFFKMCLRGLVGASMVNSFSILNLNL